MSKCPGTPPTPELDGGGHHIELQAACLALTEHATKTGDAVSPDENHRSAKPILKHAVDVEVAATTSPSTDDVTKKLAFHEAEDKPSDARKGDASTGDEDEEDIELPPSRFMNFRRKDSIAVTKLRMMKQLEEGGPDRDEGEDDNAIFDDEDDVEKHPLFKPATIIEIIEPDVESVGSAVSPEATAEELKEPAKVEPPIVAPGGPAAEVPLVTLKEQVEVHPKEPSREPGMELPLHPVEVEPAVAIPEEPPTKAIVVGPPGEPEMEPPAGVPEAPHVTAVTAVLVLPQEPQAEPVLLPPQEPHKDVPIALQQEPHKDVPTALQPELHKDVPMQQELPKDTPVVLQQELQKDTPIALQQEPHKDTPKVEQEPHKDTPMDLQQEPHKEAATTHSQEADKPQTAAPTPAEQRPAPAVVTKEQQPHKEPSKESTQEAKDEIKKGPGEGQAQIEAPTATTDAAKPEDERKCASAPEDHAQPP